MKTPSQRVSGKPFSEKTGFQRCKFLLSNTILTIGLTKKGKVQYTIFGRKFPPLSKSFHDFACTRCYNRCKRKWL